MQIEIKRGKLIVPLLRKQDFVDIFFLFFYMKKIYLFIFSNSYLFIFFGSLWKTFLRKNDRDANKVITKQKSKIGIP